jgi:hypothetical protein
MVSIVTLQTTVSALADHKTPINSAARGPHRAPSAFLETNMTKTKASSKPAASPKAPAAPAKETAALIVMGYDEHHKPCAARFTGADPNLVAKAAKLMDLEVREASSEDLAAVAKKLPVGRLYGNSRGFVPNIRQELYSEVVAALSAEPQGTTTVPEAMPVASGLPRTWEEIAAGHLVIAQETLDLGWWEAIVIGRKDDMFSLRFRDYPKIPKFVRHRSAIALMSPPAE